MRFQCSVAAEWCDECRFATCEGVAWNSEMTPSCASSLRTFCGSQNANQNPNCEWWIRSLSVCGDSTPKWKECSTRIRAQQNTLVDSAFQKRNNVRYGVVNLTKQEWEFTETFGCGSMACVPTVAVQINNQIVARAAFGYVDIPLTTAPLTPDKTMAIVSVVVIVFVVIIFAAVDFFYFDFDFSR